MKKLLSVILVLAMTVCLFGCGSSGEAGTDGSNGTSSENISGEVGNVVDSILNGIGDAIGGDDTVSTGSSQDQNVSVDSNNGGYDANIQLSAFIIDNYTVHVVLEDLNKSGLINKNADISVGDLEGDFSLSFRPDYCGISYKAGGDSWNGCNAQLYDVLKDFAYMTIKSENPVSQYFVQGMEMICNVSNAATYNYIGGWNFKLTDVRNISSDDLKTLEANEQALYEPENKAHDIWVGEFISTRWESDESMDYLGLATVELTEKGALKVSIEEKYLNFNFILKEKDFDEVDYSYGKVISAHAGLTKENYNTSVEMSYNIEADGYRSYSLTYNEYSNDGSKYYDWRLCNMPEAGKKAPDDYKDEDKYGYIDAILKDKNNFLYPTTDNYLLSALKTTDYIYDSTTETSEEFPMIELRLREYDENDYLSNEKIVCVYENESARQKGYNYRKEQWYKWYDEYEFTFSGNETRLDEHMKDVSYSYSKNDVLGSYGYELYDGCHYAYYNNTYDEGSFQYVYSSKAIDTVTTMPGVEMYKALLYVPNGTHRSLDTPNSDLSTYIYASSYGDDSSLSISGSMYVDENYIYYNSSAMMRYDGNRLTALSYNYDYYTQKYMIDIFEMEIGSEEATVTLKRFAVDTLGKSGITLDTYKNFTPDKTVTERFDMVRVR